MGRAGCWRTRRERPGFGRFGNENPSLSGEEWYGGGSGTSVTERPTERGPRSRFTTDWIRLLKLLGVSLAVIFFVLLIGIFWALDTGRAAELARDAFVSTLDERCGVRGEFSGLEFHPFPPELYVTDLIIEDQESERLIAVDEAIISLAVLPLFYGRLQFDRIALLRPEAIVVFDEGRVQNLPECLQTDSRGGSDGPIALGVAELQIEQGFFRFRTGDFDAKFDDISVIVSQGASGGTDVAFGVDHGRVGDGSKQLELDRVRLLVHVAGLLTRPRAIRIDSAEVDVKEVSVRGKGAIDLLGPVYEAEVDIEAPLSIVGEFFPGMPPMRGKARVQGSISGTPADPRAVGTISVQDGVVERFHLGDRSQIGFRVDREGVEISQLRVELNDGLVLGQGGIRFDESLSTSIQLEVQQLSLGRVLDAIDVREPWVDLKATGPIELQGTFQPFAIGGDFDLNVDGFHVFDRAYSRAQTDSAQVMLRLGATEVSGRWSADPRGIWFRDAEILSGGSAGTAECRLNFSNASGLWLRADLSTFDFVDLGAIAGIEFGGYGAVSAEMKGPYSDIRLRGEADLASITIGGVPFGQASSPVSWNGNKTLDFEGIKGKLGNSDYRAQVRVRLDSPSTFNISGEIPKGRVEDIFTPFGLKADDYGAMGADITLGQFDLQGPLDGLTGPVRLTLENFEALEEKAERGRVSARMEAGTVVVDEIELDKYGARLSGSGRWDPRDGDLAFIAFGRGLTLQKLDRVREAHPDLNGELAVRMNLIGRPGKGLTGTVAASIENVRIGPTPFEGGSLFGSVKKSTLDARGTFFGQAVQLRAKVGIERKLPYQLSFAIQELDAPRLLASWRGHEEWSGTLDASGELRGDLVDWADSQGKISLEKAQFGTGSGFVLETVGSSRFAVRRRQFETSRLVLVGPDTRMNVSGVFGRARNDVRVRGRLDLSLIESMFPAVERSGGVLTIDAVAKGQGDRLDLFGTGEIERGLLSWRGLPSRLTGGKAQLRFTQSSVVVESLTGRYAGGTISGDGQILLDGFRPSRLSLDLGLNRVRPRFRRAGYELSGVASGKVRLSGPPSELRLSGAVEVEQGRYRPKFDWSKLVNDPLKRLVVQVYDPSSEVLAFDVGVHLELARVKDETSDIEIGGDLRLVGTNERMGLLGSLTVLRGRVGFLGRTYDMRGGLLKFTERFSIRPRYELNLRARACDAIIDVSVAGTLDEFTTAYLSNPEMDGTSIVSCLKFGVRIEDSFVLGEGGQGDQRSGFDQLGGLGTGLGLEALWRLSGVDRQVRKVIPLDQIEVTTAYSPRLRVYEPRLIVGKDLGFVQLQASTSLASTTNPNQEAKAKFRLTRDLSLELGWRYSPFIPAVGDLGLDLRRRWEW